jgi:RimJ/RimL family protein N-acetyltransferase
MPAPDLHHAPAHLRALELKHASALFPAFKDAANMTYWSGPPHETIAETEGDISWWRRTYPDTCWVIEDGSGVVCGRTGLLLPRKGVGEIGIILSPAARGKGLARAAVMALCAHGFGALKLHRITADIDPANFASRRLFRACGFRREARLKKNWRTHLGLRDSYIYARFAPHRAELG